MARFIELPSSINIESILLFHFLLRWSRHYRLHEAHTSSRKTGWRVFCAVHMPCPILVAQLQQDMASAALLGVGADFHQTGLNQFSATVNCKEGWIIEIDFDAAEIRLKKLCRLSKTHSFDRLTRLCCSFSRCTHSYNFRHSMFSG